MKKYKLEAGKIALPTKSGDTLILLLTSDSGRIAYRDKINTLIGIKHPGIELGMDQFGYRWFVHHHYENTHPSIEREDRFSKGVRIFYDDRQINYNQYTIVQRSLDAWQVGAEYHWLWRNCQHFVNELIRDEKFSESVDHVSDRAIFFGALTSLLGIATGNKALTNVGLGVAAVGAVGKGVSRIK